MNSNYPPGVSSSSFGAPWNEVEEEFEFTIKVNGTLTTDGPLPNEELDEIFYQLLKYEKEQILDTLNKNFPYEFEIEDI